jgi:putative addiction module component (TIGR02574 family)
MTQAALHYKDQLLRLSPQDREELAHILWESLEEMPDAGTNESDAAWIAELDRRSAAADADPSREQPFRDVIAELRGEQP